ncbi:hypothetical protein BYT27DRAFT_7058723, partial [Phlegmacium glaucopus]
LCRRELMPNPRVDTPWQRLWASQEDRAFITTMGFDVATFRYILEGSGRFGQQWEESTIPRNDVSIAGEPRMGKRSLDGAGALGLVLHYLGSSMREVSLQQIFALTPTTLSRYLEFAQDILHSVLQIIKEATISMPRGLNEYQRLSSLIQQRHPLLEGAFGSIDGLSLVAQESDDPEIENATYNGWKTTHCINNVLVFSPEGVIISVVLNSPVQHDAHVARPIFDQLRTQVPDGYFLVSDTAFPRGTTSITGKIRAPLKGGERITAEPVAQQLTLAINRQLLSYRQTAEWGMRMMQGSFGRLRVPLPISSDKARRRLLETCVRLSNIRARCVGINQIRSVYMPIWRASEDEQLWLNLGDIIFGDIRKRDRVSRFHLQVV